MRKIYKIILSTFLTIAFSGVATAQDETGPSFSPIEIFACNFREGKTQNDLDKVIASWNKWMDQSSAEPYSAWIYTADYNSPEYSFDIAWLGVWPDGNVMGRSNDHWYSKGGESAAAFNKVLDCAVHSNFASTQIKNGTGEDGSNAVISFSDCNIGKDKNMDEVMTAANNWATYWGDQGSVESQWIFFPVFGGDVDYNFKMVSAHPNYTEFGADYERYGNGGGYIKAREIVGDAYDCGTSRVYRATRVRDGLPKQ